MILRIAASALILLAVTSAVTAQPMKAPPEKMRPVPPTPRTVPLPKTPNVHGATNESLPLVYSKWAKFCGTDSNDPQAKSICLTVREARLETGQFVAGAALIEQAGDEKKLLRVTLPLGLRLTPGVRMFVDGDAPRNGSYEICLANGCMADFEVNAKFVTQLKQGERL